jgi:hypothetical protein
MVVVPQRECATKAAQLRRESKNQTRATGRSSVKLELTTSHFFTAVRASVNGPAAVARP